MRILVVGGGGREHAILRKLRENPNVTELFAAPGNGGIGYDAQCVPLAANDVEGLLEWSISNRMDYVVVTPEDPLALGLVDRLMEQGIPAFGPSQKAAEIESSKAFAKNLMQKYHIPTARYAVFQEIAAAKAYLEENSTWPIVVKASGLALGKGVLICQNREEALRAVEEMMEQKKFGSSGSTVVIEEYLTGPEVSVLTLTDGKTIIPLVSSMDHKRALDGDQGRNTGGMGTIAPNPYYTEEIMERCKKEIFHPTIAAMNAEGRTFRGCLYFGLMLTSDGPKVIEYNCRFGDPETQVVLPLLETDLLTVLQAVSSGTLDQQAITFSMQHAACVILASGGYPGSYEKGKVIHGLTRGQLLDSDAVVYHAGDAQKNGTLVTSGGRVLGVTARGNTLQEAVSRAYEAARRISFDGVHMRTDIGARALSVC